MVCFISATQAVELTRKLLRQIKLDDVAYPSADEGIQTPDHFKGKQRNVTIAKSSRFEYILNYDL